MISYRKKSFVVHADAQVDADAAAATKRLVGLTSALGLVGDADALGVLFMPQVSNCPLTRRGVRSRQHTSELCTLPS